MPAPLSRHQHYRFHAAGLRLWALLEQLSALTDRLAPLPPTVAGPALRTITEARSLAHLAPFAPGSTPRVPGEIFAEALSVLLHLRDLNRLSFKAKNAPIGKSYARRYRPQ